MSDSTRGRSKTAMKIVPGTRPRRDCDHDNHGGIPYASVPKMGSNVADWSLPIQLTTQFAHGWGKQNWSCSDATRQRLREAGP
jgi:hypothetical protein